MILLKHGDITLETVDVIVNAANPELLGGGGVDGAIHHAAGPSVLAECRAIVGGCKVGEAVATGAGNLKARTIIHTPGPIWHGGQEGEADLLRASYENSFRLAQTMGHRTIALPAISTGVYGYPMDQAAEIALTGGLRFFNAVFSSSIEWRRVHLQGPE